MPDLVQYQLRDGPHAGEPISERGEVERLARECRAANCQAGLASTVVETRFNVVRSGVPHRVATVRRLRDYLRAEVETRPKRRRTKAPSAEPVMEAVAWSPGGR